MGKGREAEAVYPIGDSSKVAITTLDEAVMDGGGVFG